VWRIECNAVFKTPDYASTPFDLDQGAGAPGTVCFAQGPCPVGRRPKQEDTMLAPNPKAELLIDHIEDTKPTSSTFQKIIFVGVLTVAYAIAAAALLYPVLMYVWW
jgi:hypothetical protein